MRISLPVRLSLDGILIINDNTVSTVKKLFYDGWKHPNKAKQRIRAIFKILSTNWSLQPYHRYWYALRTLEYSKRDTDSLNSSTVTSSVIGRTKNPANEQFLFHGTNRFCRLGEHNSPIRPCSLPPCHLCSIIRDSFDVRRCGKCEYSLSYNIPNILLTGTKHGFRRFGDGIYTTAASSSESCQQWRTCECSTEEMIRG